MDKDRPYQSGAEYIGFLKWNRMAKRFAGVSGPHYMMEVNNGRLVANTPLRDVKAGLTIGNLVNRLRALAKKRLASRSMECY